MLIREATRFYIKSFFQGKIMGVSKGGKRGEDQFRSFSAYKVWPVIFDYLLLHHILFVLGDFWKKKSIRQHMKKK